jgi:hypothetical protein
MIIWLNESCQNWTRRWWGTYVSRRWWGTRIPPVIAINYNVLLLVRTFMSVTHIPLRRRLHRNDCLNPGKLLPVCLVVNNNIFTNLNYNCYIYNKTQCLHQRRLQKIEQHRCNICKIIFDDIDTLYAHNRMEHSENRNSPAGVS